MSSADRTDTEGRLAETAAVFFALLAEIAGYTDPDSMLDRVCETLHAEGRFRVAVLSYYTGRGVVFGAAGDVPDDIKARFRAGFVRSTPEGRVRKRLALYALRRPDTHIVFLPAGTGPKASGAYIPGPERGGSWQSDDRLMVLVPSRTRERFGDDQFAVLSLDDPVSGERPDEEMYAWLALVDRFLQGLVVLIENRQLLGRLQASEQAYGELFSALPGPVAVLRGDGRVVLTNVAPGSLEWLSINEGDNLLGLAWSENIAAGLRELLEDGQALRATEGTLKSQGHVHTVVVSGTPLSTDHPLPGDRSGSGACALVSLDNLTEIRALQSRVRGGPQLQLAARIAGDVAEEFGDLLSTLQGSLNFARNLVEGNSDPFLSQLLDDAQSMVERGSVLTRQLLSFARPRPGRFCRVDLRRVCADSAALLRRMTGEHVDIQLAMPQELQSMNGDPALLMQAVASLALAACDSLAIAIDSGVHPADWVPTVRIAVADHEGPVDDVDLTATVSDTVELPTRFVVLLVDQNGLDIPADELVHLFEPLEERGEARAHSALGLAMARGVVLQHAGRVRAIPRDAEGTGVGTAFEVWFPAV